MGIAQWAILDHKYAGYNSPQQTEVCSIVCFFLNKNNTFVYASMYLKNRTKIFKALSYSYVSGLLFPLTFTENSFLRNGSFGDLKSKTKP